jgi:transporter family protein
MFYACVSAVAAALTAVLAKIGVEGILSTLATAIRTVVITVFAWAITSSLMGWKRFGRPKRSNHG